MGDKRELTIDDVTSLLALTADSADPQAVFSAAQRTYGRH